MKRKKKIVPKLPDFNKMTYAEEATWWDTHDLGDYEDEFKETEIVFELNKPRDETLIVRLQKDFKDRLEKAARSKGLNVSTLARMWLMEKLQSNKSPIKA